LRDVSINRKAINETALENGLLTAFSRAAFILAGI
jgi:hypothetical protein